VDLGIVGRRALLVGLSDRHRAACGGTLEEEGVRVGFDVQAADPPDIVVAGWPTAAGTDLLTVDSADELHRAWDAVETTLEIYREAVKSMEANKWGRLVWVGPASAKSVDSCDDDLGAATTLAMLAVNKQVTSEVGSSQVTANAVLYGGEASEKDVADAVCFLCSRGASYMTGVTITVDGGAGSAMFP
jgi:NAD(P)-dependent dehydrogenase (short-subunit alcohol dehydrogenase family)